MHAARDLHEPELLGETPRYEFEEVTACVQTRPSQSICVNRAVRTGFGIYFTELGVMGEKLQQLRTIPHVFQVVEHDLSPVAGNNRLVLQNSSRLAVIERYFVTRVVAVFPKGGLWRASAFAGDGSSFGAKL